MWDEVIAVGAQDGYPERLLRQAEAAESRAAEAARRAEAAQAEYHEANAELEAARRLRGRPDQAGAFIRAFFRRDFARAAADRAAADAQRAAREAQEAVEELRRMQGQGR